MQTEDYGWSSEAPGSDDYLRPAILRIAESLGAKKILDAGCGNGAIAAALSEVAPHVYGVDADKAGIAIAGERHPKPSFSIGLFTDSPPAPDFDLVVSTEVVEHLYSPHELVSYAFAALKPGGHFAISTPYHGYLKNLALAIAGKWDHHHTALWHGGHIKFWSAKTLGALLSEAGFEIKNFVGVGRGPFLWKSMVLLAQKPAGG